MLNTQHSIFNFQGIFELIRQFLKKKGAKMEISARINPISYEKPYYKRNYLLFSL
jgi:hypothetical protein